MLVITKKLTPLVRFARLFYNETVFQKFEHNLPRFAVDNNQAKRSRGVRSLVILAP